jgi:hypothetical protein
LTTHERDATTQGTDTVRPINLMTTHGGVVIRGTEAAGIEVPRTPIDGWRALEPCTVAPFTSTHEPDWPGTHRGKLADIDAYPTDRRPRWPRRARANQSRWSAVGQTHDPGGILNH